MRFRDQAPEAAAGPGPAHDTAIVDRDFARLGDAPFSVEVSGAGGLVEPGVAALAALLERVD